MIIAGLIGLFFITRLIGILNLPMFTDEAIYIHWAKLAWKDASWRFVSLTDGRQPLQTWATIPFLKLIDDPLLAGRMFGVMSGLFGFVGFMILAGYLFGKKTAYIGGFLYLLNPYFLFYDRMAMVDSAVSAFFTWSLLGTLLLLRFPRLDIAIIYGLIIGLGSLSKSTARVFLLVPALIPIIWYWGDTKKIRKTINYYLLLGVVAAFMIALYNIQRLSPFMHFIEGKNLTFVRTIPQFLASPFDPLIHNLLTIPEYVGVESAFLLPIFGIIGLIVMAKKNLRLSLFLGASVLVPFGIIASLAIVLFPRYLMFLVIPLFLGMLYLVQNTRYRMFVIVLYCISVAYPLWAIYFNLNKLYLPPIDRGQYIEGVTTGYGIPDIVERIKNDAQGEKFVYVFTEGTFGLLPYALDIYTTYDYPTIRYEARWPLKDEDFTYARELKKKGNIVYFVFAEREEFNTEWGLRLVRRYRKPVGGKSIYLFNIP